METVNVVIDEVSDSGSEKSSEEIPKAILPLKPKVVQKEIDQEPISPRTSSTPSVVEVSVDIPTSLESKSHEEKGPSLRTKLNHCPKVIMGNMNELTLRKHTIDNFVSYSYYLSQVEPTKVEDVLQDESWVEAMHDELLQF